MANTKSFKRRVRERMAQTGESYMVAMHALQRELAAKPVPDQATEDQRAEARARTMAENLLDT